MKIRRFSGANTREVLQNIRNTLGPDAVILSNREVDGGVEIVTAIDFDEKQWGASSQPSLAWPESLLADAEPPSRAADGTGRGPGAAGDDERTAAISGRSKPQGGARAAPAELAHLHSELNALRRLVEARWGGTMEQPSRERFMDLGFSAEWATQLAELGGGELESALQEGLAGRMSIVADPLGKGGVFAVLGPTGSGKTTSIAKLAARQVLRHGPRSVALMTTDTYRIAGVEQLGIYGRILGVPVDVIRSPEDLLCALERHRDRTWVFIDTIGMSPRDPRLEEQLHWLGDLGSKVRKLLLVNAGLSGKSLPAVLSPYLRLPLDGAILSKVDESPAFGAALEWLAEQSLPLCFFSDGQRVPEDLHSARWEAIIAHMLAAEHGAAMAAPAQYRYHAIKQEECIA